MHVDPIILTAILFGVAAVFGLLSAFFKMRPKTDGKRNDPSSVSTRAQKPPKASKKSKDSSAGSVAPNEPIGSNVNTSTKPEAQAEVVTDSPAIKAAPRVEVPAAQASQVSAFSMRPAAFKKAAPAQAQVVFPSTPIVEAKATPDGVRGLPPGVQPFKPLHIVDSAALAPQANDVRPSLPLPPSAFPPPITDSKNDADPAFAPIEKSVAPIDILRSPFTALKALPPLVFPASSETDPAKRAGDEDIENISWLTPLEDLPTESSVPKAPASAASATPAQPAPSQHAWAAGRVDDPESESQRDELIADIMRRDEETGFGVLARAYREDETAKTAIAAAIEIFSPRNAHVLNAVMLMEGPLEDAFLAVDALIAAGRYDAVAPILDEDRLGEYAAFQLSEHVDIDAYLAKFAKPAVAERLRASIPA